MFGGINMLYLSFKCNLFILLFKGDFLQSEIKLNNIKKELKIPANQTKQHQNTHFWRFIAMHL